MMASQARSESESEEVIEGEINNDIEKYVVSLRTNLINKLAAAGRPNVQIDTYAGKPAAGKTDKHTWVTYDIDEIEDTDEYEYRFFLTAKSFEMEELEREKERECGGRGDPAFDDWLAAFQYERTPEAKKARHRREELWYMTVKDMGYEGDSIFFTDIDAVLDLAPKIAEKHGSTEDHVIDVWVKEGILYERRLQRSVTGVVSFRAYDLDRQEYINNPDRLN